MALKQECNTRNFPLVWLELFLSQSVCAVIVLHDGLPTKKIPAAHCGVFPTLPILRFPPKNMSVYMVIMSLSYRIIN